MEQELELWQLWKVLRKHWGIMIALPLIAAITSGLISFFVLSPVYVASTTLIVGQKASATLQDAAKVLDYDVILANEKLAKTYGAIAQSRAVEQNVLTALNLTMTVEEFNQQVSVNLVKDTELLEIQVSNTSPELAATIANTMNQEFSKAVIDIKKVDSVSIVDRAVIPVKPVKPNKTMNVLIAFFAGLMASAGVAFLLETMDTTIKTANDVTTLLGIPVLCTIPQGQKGESG